MAWSLPHAPFKKASRSAGVFRSRAARKSDCSEFDGGMINFYDPFKRKLPIPKDMRRPRSERAKNLEELFRIVFGGFDAVGPFHFAFQPSTSINPVAFHGSRRVTEQLGRFFDRQFSEVPQFN